MALLDTNLFGPVSFNGLAESDTVPAGSTVTLPGRGTTYVIDTGAPAGNPEAPTLFLLHALACTGSLTWFAALKDLSQHYRCVLLDQRWHGQGIRSEKFSLEDCADDVVALADVLNIDSFLVAGYSMGGMVAQLVAHRHPHRVDGLALCSTASTFQHAPIESAAIGAITKALSFVRLSPGSLPFGENEPTVVSRRWAYRQFRQTATSAITGVAKVLLTFDSSSWVHTLNVPTAVVITTDDAIIAPSRQEFLAREIPHAAAYEVAAGHAACSLEYKDWIPALLAAIANIANRQHDSLAQAA